MTDLEAAIEIPVDQVLERFEHGDRWLQGTWSNDEGECLHNGIRACQPQKGDAFLIEQVAAHFGWGTEWNDEPGRTYDDIKQALVQHREIMPSEMLATFGPQWADVVGIVREAAGLTEQQANDLAAAHTADYAAIDAAAHAAYNAARHAAESAAYKATANATVNDAARHAARHAATAIATRHLIGSHGYTQQHYDTLVAPWETIMGTTWTRETVTA